MTICKSNQINNNSIVIFNGDQASQVSPEVNEEEAIAIKALAENTLIPKALIESCDAAIASSLQEEKSDIERLLIEYEHNPLGWPGLSYAIEQNRPDVAKEFLRLNPASAHYPISRPFPHLGGHNVYPIELAIKKGQNELVKILLKLGKNPDYDLGDIPTDYNMHQAKQIDTYHFYTQLYWAITYQQEEAVQLMLDHGVRLKSVHYFWKVDWSRHGRGYRFENMIHQTDFSALQIAAEIKNRAIIEIIIREQIKRKQLNASFESSDVDLVCQYESNENNWPGVHQAIQSGDLNALKRLLQIGCEFRTVYNDDPESLNKQESAFQLAMKKNDHAFCELLLVHGFDRHHAFKQAVMARDNYWIKTLASPIEIFKTTPYYILDNATYDAVTALRTAISMDDEELAMFLCEKGFIDIKSIKEAYDHGMFALIKYICKHSDRSLLPYSSSSWESLSRDLTLRAIRDKNDDFLQFFYIYRAVPEVTALLESMKANNTFAFEYMLQRAIPTHECYKCAVELNRLDFLQALQQKQKMPDETVRQLANTAIKMGNESMLRYLLSLIPTS